MFSWIHGRYAFTLAYTWCKFILLSYCWCEKNLRSDGAAFIRFRKGNHPSKVVEADQGSKNRDLLLPCVVIINSDYWLCFCDCVLRHLQSHQRRRLPFPLRHKWNCCWTMSLQQELIFFKVVCSARKPPHLLVIQHYRAHLSSITSFYNNQFQWLWLLLTFFSCLFNLDHSFCLSLWLTLTLCLSLWITLDHFGSLSGSL